MQARPASTFFSFTYNNRKAKELTTSRCWVSPVLRAFFVAAVTKLQIYYAAVIKYRIDVITAYF